MAPPSNGAHGKLHDRLGKRSPWIGKSALLALAAEIARSEGLDVLTARGGVLEIRHAFGVVRQLLGPIHTDRHSERTDVVLRGPAGRAWVAVEGASRGAPDEGTLMYGLVWLVAELCERRPLAIVVDDPPINFLT